MKATKIETTIQVDGELHLKRLPVRRGDRIEAILLSLDEPAAGPTPEQPAPEQLATEAGRQAARQEFQELAKSSTFRSTAPHPTRAELHESH